MIIGMLGFAGSGKGTAGDILESDFGFVKESFAKPLKDAVAAIFGWSRELLEGDTQASRAWREQEDGFWHLRIPGLTPRKALQLMGTEAGRNVFDTDLWLYSLEKRLDPDKNYVITDVRFPNEMAFIRKIGGVIVRVKRGPEPLWYDEAVNTNTYFKGVQTMPNFPNIHYSEWAWIGTGVEHTINNDGTLEDFKKDISLTLDNIRSKEYNVIV